MNSLIALKWYNLIWDCNSVTESASLSLYRIRKPKPLYFNISPGRNHSSFYHWNRDHIKMNLDCRKSETTTYQAIFINSTHASNFWNRALKETSVQFIQIGGVTLAAWVTDGWERRVHKFSNERKSDWALSTAFGIFWNSSFYPNPQPCSTWPF